MRSSYAVRNKTVIIRKNQFYIFYFTPFLKHFYIQNQCIMIRVIHLLVDRIVNVEK